MGHQVAFVLLIILSGMIFTQILMLANNQKKQYNNIKNDIKLIIEKLEIKS